MGAIDLNYHHLQYFWEVATDGNLTRTARRLRVSPSALSTQIRQLEERLERPLFEREGRRLKLTEAGHIALRYAETIFRAGGELVATLEEGRREDQLLRVGAVSTLSRNFQDSLLTPLLDEPEVRLRMQTGTLELLLDHLAHHEQDLVLSNRPAPRSDEPLGFRSRRLARQEVSLIGRPRRRPFRWPEDVGVEDLLLPTPDSAIRTGFDALCAQLGVDVRVKAEVDDMAMMRLLTRDANAVALLPSVVVRDELQSGQLEEWCVVPGLHETFYAITVERLYPHPLVERLVSRHERDILAMELSEKSGRRGE